MLDENVAEACQIEVALGMLRVVAERHNSGKQELVVVRVAYNLGAFEGSVEYQGGLVAEGDVVEFAPLGTQQYSDHRHHFRFRWQVPGHSGKPVASSVCFYR